MKNLEIKERTYTITICSKCGCRMKEYHEFYNGCRKILYTCRCGNSYRRAAVSV